MAMVPYNRARGERYKKWWARQKSQPVAGQLITSFQCLLQIRTERENHFLAQGATISKTI